MKIKTNYDFPPIPDRRFDWSAIDEDTYDGAEDSDNRHMIGYGATEQQAIEDLMRLLQEMAEVKLWEKNSQGYDDDRS
jgi:hypothetical protein